jgi:hypothetical protein
VNLIELSPCRCDFAESALAEIPPFIVRPAQTITPAITKNEQTSITLRKPLELEWIEIELQDNVVT